MGNNNSTSSTTYGCLVFILAIFGTIMLVHVINASLTTKDSLLTVAKRGVAGMYAKDNSLLSTSKTNQRVSHGHGLVMISSTLKPVKGFGVITGTEEVYSGTGFHIGNGIVVTAAHIIDQTGSVSVVQGKVTEPASIVFLDAFKDIAILSINRELPGKEILGNLDELQANDPVTILGFPKGKWTSLRGSVVEKNVKLERISVPVFQINSNIERGNSGGPVFDKDGRVVGMVVGIGIDKNGNDIPGVAYAIPVEYIQTALSR